MPFNLPLPETLALALSAAVVLIALYVGVRLWQLEKLVRYEKADKGVMVITRTLTEQARHWAGSNSIALYDGDEFLKAFRNLRAK